MSDYSPPPECLGRRKFLRQIPAGALMAAGLPSHAWALRSQGQPEVLRGTEFDLTIAEMAVDFSGRERYAVAVNGSIPAPILYWKQGSEVTLRVTNRLQTQTSIHWHGVLVPFEMDGVPGVSFTGIAPNDTFVYRFKVRQAGTFWYHSHTRF